MSQSQSNCGIEPDYYNSQGIHSLQHSSWQICQLNNQIQATTPVDSDPNNCHYDQIGWGTRCPGAPATYVPETATPQPVATDNAGDVFVNILIVVFCLVVVCATVLWLSTVHRNRRSYVQAPVGNHSLNNYRRVKS